MDDADFDPEKDAANRRKHALSLDRFPSFDKPPLILTDDRFDYQEVRYIAVGRIEERPHVVTFTLREGRVRMIGFRRAHEKEMRRYGL
jgi:uncharacterized protein